MKTIQHRDAFQLAKEMRGYVVLGANTATTYTKYPVPPGLAIPDKNIHRAIMGRGAAKQACQEIDGIAFYFGFWLETSFPASSVQMKGRLHSAAIENPPFMFSLTGLEAFSFGIVCFLVKEAWWEKARLDIIEKQANYLKAYLRVKTEVPFLLTRVGCGNGGLDWKDVYPILQKTLGEFDNLTLVEQPL